MIRLTLRAAVLLAACLTWNGSAAAQGRGSVRPGVQGLAWLAGCWQLRAGARLVEEHWMAPRGGLMLGMSRTTRGDTLVEFEQLLIYLRGGGVVYAAQPSRQSPAEFEAIAVTDTLVVFENPAHDFPQRIIYRRRGADSLVARIEGTRAGESRGADFPYARVPCAPR